MKSLILEYQKLLGDKHTYDKNGIGIRQLDFRLRESIGKTEDIRVARASHNIIRSIEEGEGFCRICHKDLRVVGEARVNDYLVLRHPFCKAPICLDCSKNRPDAFYNAFEAGLRRQLEGKTQLREDCYTSPLPLNKGGKMDTKRFEEELDKIFTAYKNRLDTEHYDFHYDYKLEAIAKVLSLFEPVELEALGDKEIEDTDDDLVGISETISKLGKPFGIPLRHWDFLRKTGKFPKLPS